MNENRKLREYRFPPREKADVYFSAIAYGARQIFLGMFCILGAVTIYTAFIQLEAFLLFLALSTISGCGALFAHLCERNILLVMESETTFVYRTLFGNVYEFRFDEIEKVDFGVAGIKIVCPSKNIFIDNAEIVSTKFRNKLRQVRASIEKVDLSELPDPAEKTDQLKRTFYRRR